MSRRWREVLWLTLLLTACAEPPGLTPQQQGKAMAETIVDKPACRDFVTRLTDPANDAATIARLQREAVVAHCLKPTV